MNTTPEINQLVSTPEGVAVARVHTESIAIFPTENGSKFINVQNGDKILRFLLDRSQCEHLADILTDHKRPQTSPSTI